MQKFLLYYSCAPGYAGNPMEPGDKCVRINGERINVIAMFLTYYFTLQSEYLKLFIIICFVTSTYFLKFEVVCALVLSLAWTGAVHSLRMFS